MDIENRTRAAEVNTRCSLIGRLRNLEDRDSWQDFFDTYWKLIYSVARKAGLNESEAEDVVQETTATVAKCIQEYQYDRKVCSFKNWLLHKTRWRIIDQVRKRQPGFVESFAAPPDSRTTSTIERIPDPNSLELNAVWNHEWQKNLIETAMERVKHRINSVHFQIFYLSAIRKLRPRKIAEALSVNVARVYLVRHRVAGLIKEEIQLIETKASEPKSMFVRAEECPAK